MLMGLAAQYLHPCGSLQHIMRRYFAVRVSHADLACAGHLRRRRVCPPLRLPGRPRKHPRQKVSSLIVREVRGRMQCGNGQWAEVRLWTRLGEQQASAEELLEVNQGTLLAAQHTETAAQQVATMMMARSLLAEELMAIAEASAEKAVRQAGALRISFALCQEYTVVLFWCCSPQRA